MITEDNLNNVFPSAKPLVIDCIMANLDEFDKRSVNTPLRLVHFFAQCGEETGGLIGMIEGGSKALPEDFSQYDDHPGLGNTEPGDGFKYRGRGMIQLTGKGNYKWIGGALGRADDYLSDPTIVAESPDLLISALEYWHQMNLNHWADNDDIIKITKLINGGLNGLDERIRYSKLLKEELL